ncbi:DUF2586 domain-containing protein [Mannheimia haemolytica]
MTTPSVTINTLNNNQGKPAEVEKIALFVGGGTTNAGTLLTLSGDSDLDQLLGADDTPLKKAIVTAKANSGDSANWFAYAYPMQAESYDFNKAVKEAMETVNFEFAVNTNTANANAGFLNGLQTLYTELLGTYSRRVFFIQAVAGIESGTQSWEQYIKALKAITNNVVADHVMAVPELLGNDVGALAGRLAHSATTVADSPCRVKTGALLNLATTERPKDKDGTLLSIAHIKQLDSYRFSSLMWYADKEGYYWADGLTLDSSTGDYNVIENVRVVDKAARAVRLLAINQIGDRSFNASASSIEMNKTYLLAPLREMSTATTIGTQFFPGECYPPKDGDIEITWKTKTSVEIYLLVRPYECPKTIKVGIALDLTTLGGGE